MSLNRDLYSVKELGYFRGMVSKDGSREAEVGSQTYKGKNWRCSDSSGEGEDPVQCVEAAHSMTCLSLQ